MQDGKRFSLGCGTPLTLRGCDVGALHYRNNQGLTPRLSETLFNHRLAMRAQDADRPAPIPKSVRERSHRAGKKAGRTRAVRKALDALFGGLR